MRYKSFITSAAVAAMSLQGVFALPSITVESVVQRWPWNNFFDITYTISGDGGQDIANFNYCKVIFTATIPGRAEPVVIDGSSDVVAKAENGTWTVTWTNAPAGVKADNCTMVASLYRTTGDYMVVDLDTGAYAFDDLATGDTATATPTASNARYNTPLYKTDRMVFRRVPRTSDAAAAYSGGYPTGHADFSAPTYTGAYTNSVATWETDKDYFVGLFEVTQGQVSKFELEAKGYSGTSDDRLLPQTKVSWLLCNGNKASQDLCAPRKSIAMNGEKPGLSFICNLKVRTDLDGFTLPTSVMWEIAARAGATTVYPWGDSWKTGFAVVGASRASAVGSKNSNNWGLFDMIGNAAEHTLDSRLASDLADAPNPWTALTAANLGLTDNYRREARGGRAVNASSHADLKTSNRPSITTNYETTDDCVGFRLAFMPKWP